MSNIWFLSDPHFGHGLAATIRGFDGDVATHDSTLERKFLKVVQPDDTVWWLGDIAFGQDKQGIFDRLKALPGHHHLILGNHDRCHPMHPNSWAHQARYLDTFESVQTGAKLTHKGEHFVLSHFPYEKSGEEWEWNERGRAAYQWYLKDMGVALVHGHTHSKEMITRSSEGSLQVNVNLESTDMSPVHINDILGILRKG